MKSDSIHSLNMVLQQFYRSYKKHYGNNLDWYADRDLAMLSLAQHMNAKNGLSCWHYHQLLRQALEQCAKKGAHNLKDVKAHYHRLKNQFMSRPHSDYIIVSHISISSSWPAKRRSIDGVEISLMRQLPPKLEKSPPRSWAYSFNPANPPPEALAIVLKISAADADDAYLRALDAFGIIRGIWCLFRNRFRGFVWSSGLLPPLNDFRFISPITVHCLQNIEENLGYAPVPLNLDWGMVERVSCKADVLLSFEHQVRHRLRQWNEGVRLARLLRRYVHALDNDDNSMVFLGLWILIEELTGGLESTYDHNLRRLCRAIDAPIERRNILYDLRQLRNRFVHDGEQPSDWAVPIWQLRKAVEEFLLFLLERGHLFSNYSDLLCFLDLPEGKLDLLRRKCSTIAELRRIKHALSIIAE